MKYNQGKYQPQNPKKYVGNTDDIVFRSGLELIVMRKLDSSPDVIRWTSETIVVPYFDPVKCKARRYFPDFVMTKINTSGVEETVMIEVKPRSETRKPSHKHGKRRDRVIREETTWATNKAKWIAATEYCRKNGWSFQVIDETHIKGKKP